MKITNEINKFIIDVVKAIHFILASDISLSLLINMASIPKRGTKSKEDNNICLKKNN
jgi:hypothetical protein